jgi:hypothetical protein
MLSLILAPALFAQANLPPTVMIPSVGCGSDGQLGPLAAPRPGTSSLRASAGIAQKLAFYKAENGPGVLGPRDWFCFGTYGSSGASLYISPRPIRQSDLFSDGGHRFAGPAVEISLSYGGTSGRFAVAQAIARVFPSNMDFLRRVIAEGIESESDFPRGPYPQDRLFYRSHEVVEYQTPARRLGFGTESRLAPNDSSIEGLLILDTKDDFALYHLALRLPTNLRDLGPIILDQAEQEAK